MKNSLNEIKTLFSQMNQALDFTVRMLPERGLTSEDSQRAALIESLQEVDMLINGLSEDDLEAHPDYPDHPGEDVVAYGISSLNRAKNMILRDTLDPKHEYHFTVNGAPIKIFVSEIDDMDDFNSAKAFYEANEETIKESLADLLYQGFVSGEYETLDGWFIDWTLV